MSLRRLSMFTALGLAVLAIGQPAQAAFSNFNGSIPVSALGAITTDTGNINTATMITIPAMGYTGGAVGDFINVPAPATPFSPPTPIAATSTTIMGLNPTATGVVNFGGFTFGAPGFGMFMATSYIVLATGSQTQAYEFFGTYTTGSDFTNDPNAGSGPASFTLNLTQQTPGGAIGSSATIDVPPLAVPEPASVVLVGLGLVGAAGAARRRIAK